MPIYINSPDSSVHAFVVSQPVNTKAKTGNQYYWYSKNTILSTDGGYSGKLLHDRYTSYYTNHNLKSQGTFTRGLKTGTWRCWYANGRLREEVHFSDGQMHGVRHLYDTVGELSMRIYYRNGARAGKTKIFSQGKEDSVIRYRNDVPLEKKKKIKDTAAAGNREKDSCRISEKQKENRKRDSGRIKKRDSPDTTASNRWKRILGRKKKPKDSTTVSPDLQKSNER